LEALCDFFPQPARLMLRKVLDQTQARQREAAAVIEAKGDELIRAALDRAAAKAPAANPIGG
jgi:hypothetical protein